MFESPIVLIVIVVAGIFIALLIVLMLLSKNYIKVSPNQAAVISGRTRRLTDGTTVGYRQVRGGATLVVPFLEKVEYLDLNVITVPLATSRAYTVEGVPVSVKAVANVKIKGDDQSLRAASERFSRESPRARFYVSASRVGAAPASNTRSGWIPKGPTTTTSRATTGGDELPMIAEAVSTPSVDLRSIMPLSPKPATGRPVWASSATSRNPGVTTNTRSSPAPSVQ